MQRITEPLTVRKRGKARWYDFGNHNIGRRQSQYRTTTGGPNTDVRHSFPGACHDAKIEGLVWHDLRATYGTRLGEAGFNAYDIAKLMGHANISTSQHYVHNLPVGSGEAVMLKNLRRHNTVTGEGAGTLALVVKC